MKRSNNHTYGDSARPGHTSGESRQRHPFPSTTDPKPQKVSSQPQNGSTFHHLLEKLPAGAYTCDTEGLITYYNQHAVRLWGRKPKLNNPVDRFCGSFKLFKPDGSPIAHEQCWMALALKMDQEYNGHEIVIERTNGTRITVLAHANPIHDESGQQIGAVNVLMDISNRKQMEEALRKSKNRLHQLNETLEQQVADRTAQLQLQTQQLRLLANELTTTEQRERKKLAKTLHDGLQQMLVGIKMQLASIDGGARVEGLNSAEQLLADAIDVSRSLACELSPPILHDSNLPEALQWLSRWFADNHQFQVNLEVLNNLPTLPENTKVFLFSAVRELLLNAIKHSGVNKSQIKLSAVNQQVQVEVRDEGKGFDPAHVGKAAEPKSFGLLSIRERVTALGGNLAIDSSPQEGAQFTLSLPIVAEKTKGKQPKPPDLALTSNGHSQPKTQTDTVRILVADDHHIVRQGLVSMLESQQEFELVGEAVNGLEVVEQTQEMRPDVIIMDVNMPKVDGVQATRQIKDQYPEVQIIGLSVHEAKDKAAAMHKAGAYAYLQKDGPSELLFETICQSVQNRTLQE